MALSVATGSFNITTGTSDVVLTPGFTARAIKLWYTGRTTSTDSAGGANFRRGIGLVQDASNQGCVYNAGNDGGASMVTTRGHRTGACIVEADPATNAIVGRAHVSAISSTQVTFAIDDAFVTDLRVQYIIIGDDGATTTQASFSTFALSTSVGTQDITTPGFQPDVVFLASSPSVTASPDDPTDNESSLIGLGFGASATARYGLYGGNDDGSTAGDALGYGISTECVIMGADSSPGTEAPRADFNGMLSTGFQMDIVEGGIAIQVYFLAIKGPQVAVGNLSGSTSLNGTTTVSGLAFEPKAIVLVTDGKVQGTANTATAHDVWSVGYATSTTNRVCQGSHDENVVASQECATAIEHDEIVVILGAADAVDALYDVDAILSDGFRIICDDAPTSVSPFIGYVAFGNAASAAQTLTPSAAAAAFSISAPTVTKGPRTLTPSAVSATWSTVTVTLIKTNTLTPSPIIATWSTPAPTVVQGAGAITPSPVSAALSIPAPSVLLGTVVLTPSAASASFTVSTPSVTTDVTLTPGAIVATWSIATPFVDDGSAPDVSLYFRYPTHSP